MESNTDEKLHIASLMSQTLEIMDMLDNVKSDKVRVSLSPDSEETNSFSLQGGLVNDMINSMRSSLLARLTELEMNYFNLKQKEIQ
jgi:hypothetical protein